MASHAQWKVARDRKAVPTVPLLARLARAKESELDLTLVGETSRVVFTARVDEAA